MMKKYLKIGVTIGVVFSIVFSSVPAYAADSPISDCKNTLVPLYDIEAAAFLIFLDENFKNKSSTSSLVNIAIVRYDEYRNNIENIFDTEIAPYSTESLQSDELLAHAECVEISAAYIDLMKERMVQHIKTTNYQKKTSILLEKYQSINSKLAELNYAIAQMYAYFVTFKNKLPGFLRECIRV